MDMDVALILRAGTAQQRSANLVAVTAGLLNTAYDLRHRARNLRHAIGLLRTLRRLQAVPRP